MAVTFDGTDDYLVTTTLGNFGGAMDGGFSLSVWYKSSSTAAQGILGTANSGGGNTIILVRINQTVDAANTADFIRFYVRSENAVQVTNAHIAASTHDGAWHHLVIVANFPADGDVEFYVDGVQVAPVFWNTASPAAAANFNQPLYVGAVNSFGTANSLFNGQLADLFLTKDKWRAGVAPRIYAHRRVPLDLFTSNKVLYLPLMGPTGAAVDTAHWGTRDLSGNGNHVASVNSAPTWADDPLPPQAWVDGWFGGAWAAVGATRYPAAHRTHVWRNGPITYVGGT